jgi:hypothetical protein
LVEEVDSLARKFDIENDRWNALTGALALGKAATKYLDYGLISVKPKTCWNLSPSSKANISQEAS